MKLNVGSGPHPMPGWINLEMGTDDCQVRGSIFALPFVDASFTHVYLGHILEHLAWERVPDALAEVSRVLRGNGEVMVVGPCLDRAVATEQPYWLLRQILTTPPAASRHDGLDHLWTSTELLTLVAVQSVFPGAKPLPVGDVVRPDWPNTVVDDWQFAISAIATT